VSSKNPARFPVGPGPKKFGKGDRGFKRAGKSVSKYSAPGGGPKKGPIPGPISKTNP
jgi:hypothetical protein